MKNVYFVVALACVTMMPVAMADEYTAPKNEEPCANSDEAATEFPSAESVWWGNRDRAHGPYLKFAKSELPPLTREFPIIYFDLDKSKLRERGEMICNDIAKYMKAQPSATITVSGHCCDWATNTYNIKLGQRRANAVKAKLVSLGIDGNRIATATYGEEHPAHDNAGKDRPLNRRAEAMVTLDRP